MSGGYVIQNVVVW